MKCPICKGDGTSNICINGTFLPCSYCDGKGTVEELTNAEWLRQASDEELAEVLRRLTVDAFDDCRNDNEYWTYADSWVEWLQEAHN